MPGWRFKRDRLELKVFAGLDIKNDITSPYDPSNRLHGTSVGIRGAVNLWFEPPRHHGRRRRLADLDRQRLLGASRLWLAAARLVLSRPGGADLRLYRL